MEALALMDHPFTGPELVAALNGLRPAFWRLTRDSEALDDLTQATALRALSRSHQFEPGSDLGAWLWSIGRSVFLDRCRYDARRRYTTLDAASGLGMAPRQEDICYAHEVMRAAGKLPAVLRRVVLMCALDIPQQDIAVLSHSRRCTVKSRAWRGRQQLAEMVS